jgi:hypothetical protein
MFGWPAEALRGAPHLRLGPFPGGDRFGPEALGLLCGPPLVAPAPVHPGSPLELLSRVSPAQLAALVGLVQSMQQQHLQQHLQQGTQQQLGQQQLQQGMQQQLLGQQHLQQGMQQQLGQQHLQQGMQQQPLPEQQQQQVMQPPQQPAAPAQLHASGLARQHALAMLGRLMKQQAAGQGQAQAQAAAAAAQSAQMEALRQAFAMAKQMGLPQ